MQSVEEKTIDELQCEELLEAKLEDFEYQIECNKNLEIDSVIEENGVEGIKVVNHTFQEAFFVPIEVIVKNPIKALVNALATNVFDRVFSVTRIVGYYSRIQTGWNKSKLGELRDRIKGNYWEGLRKNTGDIAFL